MKLLHYEDYDTSAVVTGHLDEGGDTLYIEMDGILGHVRAIAAAMTLLNNRKQDSPFTLDKQRIHLERYGHYRIFTTKAPDRKAHGITTKAILIHDKLTAVANVEEAFYILLPPDHDLSQPPAHFFDRLRLAVDVPMSAEWQDWLWQDALKREHGYRSHLITIVKGYNIAAAKVYVDSRVWVDLIRAHFNLKCVLRPALRDGVKVYCSDDSFWQLVQQENQTWTIYQNGQQVIADRRSGDKVEQIPVVDMLNDVIGYAKTNLGIVFELGN